MKKIALVGTGPVGLGFITQMAESLEKGSVTDIASIDVFDSYGKYGLGAGLPYDPETTDPEHLLNIKTALNQDAFGKSLDWFKSNEVPLKTKFYQIYAQRLNEKLEKTAPEKHEDLYAHYEKIWQSIEKRYLNFETAETYHPRILMGMRNIVMFEEALQKIRDHGVEVVTHTQTEVTSLEKIAQNQISLGFKDQNKTFSDVVLATGRWRVRDSEPKPRQIPEIWPISDFKADLSRMLREEVALRQQENNPSKEIKIAIQGQSLTAIDALKTIFNDGLFEEEVIEEKKVGLSGEEVTKEKTRLKFTPQDFEGYQIKVDLLARTANLMQAVKGKQNWEKQEKFSGTYPQETEITQKIFQDLANDQDGKIRLWQWMLVNARALENGYRIDGQEESANQAREFIKLIIFNVLGKDLPTNSDQILDDVKGNTLEQLRQIQERFSLPLDSTNYQAIMTEFRNRFLNKPPLEQLDDSLRIAENGDTQGGYLMWKAIYGQNDDLLLTPFLPPEESAFHLQYLLRLRDAFHNGMPIQTAKELLAMRDANVIEYKTIDRQNSEPVFDPEKNKVGIRMADQNIEFYDVVASARGYSIDFSRNVSPLAKSLAKHFSFVEEPWNPNVADLTKRFGAEETQEMLKFHREGNFCTGDYRRKVVFNDENQGVARQPIDENNNPVLEKVLIPISAGTTGAILNGKRAFLHRFGSQQKEIPSPEISERSQPQKLQLDSLVTEKF